MFFLYSRRILHLSEQKDNSNRWYQHWENHLLNIWQVPHMFWLWWRSQTSEWGWSLCETYEIKYKTAHMSTVVTKPWNNNAWCPRMIDVHSNKCKVPDGSQQIIKQLSAVRNVGLLPAVGGTKHPRVMVERACRVEYEGRTEEQRNSSQNFIRNYFALKSWILTDFILNFFLWQQAEGHGWLEMAKEGLSTIRCGRKWTGAHYPSHALCTPSHSYVTHHSNFKPILRMWAGDMGTRVLGPVVDSRVHGLGGNGPTNVAHSAG